MRVHIRATTDVSKGFESELTVADVSATSAKVEAWLGDVLEAGQLEQEGVKTIRIGGESMMSSDAGHLTKGSKKDA